MIICPNCGAQNNDGARFCGNCGADLSGYSGMNSETRNRSSSGMTQYKWISVGLLAASLLIVLTQAWVSVSDAISSLMGLAGYAASLLPDSMQGIASSLQSGGLRLMQIPRLLIMAGGLSGGSDGETYIITGYIFYALIIAGIVCLIVELIFHFLDKKLNFLSFGLFCADFVLLLIGVAAVNSSASSAYLGSVAHMSVWSYITMIMLLVAAILWKLYSGPKAQKKYVHMRQPGEMQGYGQAYNQGYYNAETNQPENTFGSGQGFTNSSPLSSPMAEGFMGYAVLHGRMLIIMVVTFFLFPILQRALPYDYGTFIYNFLAILSYVTNLMIGIFTGYLIVAVIQDDIVYMVLYGIFGTAGSVISNYYMLSTTGYSALQIVFNCFDYLILLAILIIMKKTSGSANDNTDLYRNTAILYLMLAGILANWAGSIYITTENLFVIIGMMEMLHLYASQPEKLEKVFGKM